jgi:hypothetical protein
VIKLLPADRPLARNQCHGIASDNRSTKMNRYD